jgi:hypothetical protein
MKLQMILDELSKPVQEKEEISDPFIYGYV